MKVVGLTGGIACGKSTVAMMLKELGATIIDADQISHELTAPGGDALPALREAFGEFVFYPDGTLNRSVLASIVFENEKERQKLNDATHPMIQERLVEEIEVCRKMGALVVVLDVPLLYEVGLESLADITICCSAPQDVQLERLKTRSGLEGQQALNRINSQWALEEKEKLSDIVIKTDKHFGDLQHDVQEYYNTWISSLA
ncbi:MAG: dephospho-CoA kinase [Clostridiales bacterium]|nr:dephospho-CoA kinase [Clostridiales bacterium]